MKIVAIGRALPQYVLDNQELSGMVETNDEWIATRTGICQRYIAKGETVVALASQAARQALDRAEVPLESIGVVIVCTFTPDTATPSVACMVQKELGLPQTVLAFDLNAACSGFVYGLAVAEALMGRQGCHALVIGAELLSRLVDYTDRSTCILFGDGAGAAVVSPAGSRTVTDFGSDGNAELLSGGGYSASGGREPLRMNGREVFRFAVSAVPGSIRRVVEQAGCTLEEVGHFVLHQANHRITEGVARHLGVNLDRFYENIAHTGNTSAASIPLALWEMQEKNLLHPGDRLVLAGFGGGLTWGAMLLNW